MSLWVKLCGIRSLGDLESAIEAGADAVGLVMTPSPRRVEVETARAIVAAARGEIETVAVFHFPDQPVVELARDVVGFDLYQAEAESLSGIDGIVTLPVVHDGDSLVSEVSSSLLSSGSGKVLVEGAGKGGRGVRVDARRVSQLGSLERVVLAGGLTARNVSELVDRLKPGGVDVSSGVESERGVKDRKMMAEFVSAARQSEGG